MMAATKHDILVLGASGMLGNAMLRYLVENTQHRVKGTLRSAHSLKYLPNVFHSSMINGVDVEQTDSLIHLFARHRPTIVINCIGVVKQLDAANDPLAALPINSMLPHRLALLCEAVGSKLIHFSTDCVFSGNRGMYTEDDLPDAYDLYGKSKSLGELDHKHCITLRTSIIGHELGGSRSLVGWFLAQSGPVKGYKNAIFSGLPTVEIARIVAEHILPRVDISGLYHVSAEPIDKYQLLKLIADVYNKAISIEPDEKVVIDRSLDSTRFRIETGYQPPTWPELVKRMQIFR